MSSNSSSGQGRRGFVKPSVQDLQARLIEPAFPVTEPALRRRIQLLSSLLLIFLMFIVLGIVLTPLSGFGGRRSFYLFLLTTLVLVAPLYALSRTRFYRIAVWVALTFMSGFPFVALVTRGDYTPARVQSVLLWLVASFLLGVLLLSWRSTLILIAANSAAVLALPIVFPVITFQTLTPALGFLGTAAALILGNIRYRDLVEEDRRHELLHEKSFSEDIINGLPGIFFMHDAQGQLIRCNKKLEAVLGHSLEEMERMTMPEMLNPQAREPLAHLVKQVFEAGRADIEMNLTTKHGRTIPYYLTALRETVAHQPYLLGFGIDVTARKLAEEQVRRNNRRYRALFDRTSDGVMVIDLEGTVLEANQQAGQMLGYTAEEVIGIPHQRIIAPDEHTASRAVYDLLLSGQVVPVYERNYVRKDGTRVTAEVNVAMVYDENGKPVHIQSVLRDITERKRIQEILQLRLSLTEFAAAHSLEQLLQKTLDEIGALTGSPIGFYHFVEADQKTLSLQAWSTRTLAEFCQAEGQGLHYSIDQAGVWTDCVRERRPVIHNDYPTLPHRNGLPEGHAQVTRELVVPILRRDRIIAILGVGNKAQAYTDKDIELVSYVADLAWEIAERKRAEHERENLIGELESRNAELERFTYTVSHDLKAPLVTIRGFLGFLEKDAVAGNVERLKADIARITDATDKMQRLLSELLELSRIGRMIDPPQAAPFEAIAREAIERVRGQLEARGVQVDMAPNLPTVYGDRARLVEVVQNLVDNACKFMGEQAQPRIEIGQRGTDVEGKPIVFVRDNGVGIEPPYHERVFGLFNKLDARTEGTGVGLALVKRIVEVHGGRIWVESEGIGTGSAFCFTLGEKPITR